MRKSRNVPAEKPKAPAKKAPTVKKDELLKVQAISKVAYENASTAVKVANGFSDLVSGLQTAMEKLSPNNGYHMKVNRNKKGFIDTIDVEFKS